MEMDILFLSCHRRQQTHQGLRLYLRCLQTQSVQGTIPTQDVTTNNTLNRALNTSQQLQQGGNKNEDYEAHEAPSSVHSTGKAGWCFVGEDRGFRSCAQVGVNDDCMSGDIFPSQELCVNPNLRS